MRQHYYIEPFGIGGTFTPAIPNATDPSGFVSYTTGFTLDYQRDLLTDPLAKSPTYVNFNALLHDATGAIQDLQQNGSAEWISNADNGGTAFVYRFGAIVRYSGSGNPPFITYINVADNNTAVPGTDATWLNLALAVQNTRTKLMATLQLYVTAGGSDTNPGTIGLPFLTIQRAINYIYNTLDLNGFAVTVNVGGTTFTAGFIASGLPVGTSTPIIIQGVAGTTINVTNGNCIVALSGAAIQVSGMLLEATGSGNSGNGILVSSAANVTLGSGMNFGACGSAHMLADNAAGISANGISYTISGSSPVHMQGGISGITTVISCAVTLTGTPNFSSAFAVGSQNGSVNGYNNTYSGAATGLRYAVDSNGVVNTRGQQATPTTAYFPGNAPGITSTGGQII